MGPEIKVPAIRLARRQAKIGMTQHIKAMTTIQARDDPTLPVEDAIQALRYGYEDCQNMPFIDDLYLTHAMGGDKPKGETKRRPYGQGCPQLSRSLRRVPHLHL